jgi:hypothetical protein
MSKLTRRLTQAQKYSRDVDAVASGKPSRVVRRVRNRIVGRALSGVFRTIFR